MHNNHNPLEQISSGNAWYLDDQFVKQYNRPGARAVIENRWRVFEEAIVGYIKNYSKDSSIKKMRVLDAGCGDGINLIGLNTIIQKHGLDIQIYGTDYNPIRVERASKLIFTQEVIESSLHNLPYADGWFDIILCNHVLEHIPEDRRALKELGRVLSPCGMLILGVPNEGCFMGRLRNHIFERSILKATDHVNFYTRKSLSTLLVDTGFKILKVETGGFFLPHSVLQYVVSLQLLGRMGLNLMGKIWKSQSADLITISLKMNNIIH